MKRRVSLQTTVAGSGVSVGWPAANLCRVKLRTGASVPRGIALGPEGYRAPEWHRSAAAVSSAGYRVPVYPNIKRSTPSGWWTAAYSQAVTPPGFNPSGLCPTTPAKPSYLELRSRDLVQEAGRGCRKSGLHVYYCVGNGSGSNYRGGMSYVIAQENRFVIVFSSVV